MRGSNVSLKGAFKKRYYSEMSFKKSFTLTWVYLFRNSIRLKMLLRTVDQGYWFRVSISSVEFAQKCYSEVLVRSAVR